MNDFKKGWKVGVDAVGGAVGAAHAAAWTDSVEGAIDDAIRLLQEVATQRQNMAPDYIKGFAAEAWHVGTYNVDAALKRIDAWAELPKSTERGSPDMVAHLKDGSEVHYQSKYYRNPDATAKAVSGPEYGGVNKVVPSEQLDGVRDAAGRLADHNASTRPEQSAHYRHTQANASDRMDAGGVNSKPLSEADALRMGNDVKHDRFDAADHVAPIDQTIGWNHVAREAGTAAVIAAATSAAIAAAPHVLRAIRDLARDGTVNFDELKKGGGAAVRSGGSSALRGAIAAGLVSAGRAGLLGEAMKTASPPLIGAMVSVTLSAIGDAMEYNDGQIDGAELARRTARNSVIAGAATGGAMAGQVLIPIPFVGAAIGGMIGSAVGSAGVVGVELLVVQIGRQEYHQSQVALLGSIVTLGAMMQQTVIRADEIFDAQHALENALVVSGQEWRVQIVAAHADLDEAESLRAEAAVIGDEQNRRLLSMLDAMGDDA